MAYVNVGALLGNSDIQTKAALKRALATDPTSVKIYGTSEFSPLSLTRVPNLDKGNKYSVVGPNPYNARNWYATLSFNAKTDKWVVS